MKTPAVLRSVNAVKEITSANKANTKAATAKGVLLSEIMGGNVVVSGPGSIPRDIDRVFQPVNINQINKIPTLLKLYSLRSTIKEESIRISFFSFRAVSNYNLTTYFLLWIFSASA